MSLVRSRKVAQDYVMWLMRRLGIQCAAELNLTSEAIERLAKTINNEITNETLEKENH